MEFMEVVKKRRSIRKYKSVPVPDEYLKTVLEAARLAPSPKNRQCWQYIIVTDQGMKAKIAGEENKWLSEAPIIIVACINPEESGRKPGTDTYMLDIGISLEHLILAATDLGLGTCWIGAFDEKQVKEALGVPDEIRVIAYTPLGYRAEVKDKVFARKPLGDIVFYERYGEVKAQSLQTALLRKFNGLYIKGRKLGEKLRNRFAF